MSNHSCNHLVILAGSKHPVLLLLLLFAMGGPAPWPTPQALAQSKTLPCDDLHPTFKAVDTGPWHNLAPKSVDTLEIIPEGKGATATPHTSNSGSDRFAFGISGGQGGTVTGAMMLTATPVNNVPVAHMQFVSVIMNTPRAIMLMASDADGNMRTYAVVDSPTHGRLNGSPPNLTYTPAQDYRGPDSFTFKASDGQADSNLAMVFITVKSPTPPAEAIVGWGNRATYLPVNDPGHFQIVAAGGAHNLALKDNGTVIAWGQNEYGQCTVPWGLSGVVAIAAGDSHSLALKGDGSVVAWGDNMAGQSSVSAQAQRGVVAIAAGGRHSLALKDNGTVVAWGNNYWGQCYMLAELSDVIAIATGDSHSLALTGDGAVVAWGDNGMGQSNVPAAAQSGVIAIAAGFDHSLALKGDGTIIAWGHNGWGKCNVPLGLSGVVAITAGGSHNLALKADRTVVAWGDNRFGQCSVPTGLSDVIAVAAGFGYSLALKSDGTVVAWGANAWGSQDVPAGLSGVMAIAYGGGPSLALKSNVTVVDWGHSWYGQCKVPPGLGGIIDFAGDDEYSMALRSGSSAPFPAVLTATTAALSFSQDTPWAVDVEHSGAPTTQSLTLTNTGELPLFFNGGGTGTVGLSLIGPCAEDFAIQSVSPATTLPLAPGASVTVTVRFAPKKTQRTRGLEAALVVTCTSPLAPTLTIPLLGDAVPVKLSSFRAE